MEAPSIMASSARNASQDGLEASYAALIREPHAALEARYARGSIQPADFVRVHGTPRGRVLCVPALEAIGFGGLVRAYCGSKLFPWDGKSFTARTAGEGRGVNRWRLPLRGDVFQFRTELTASRVDGNPCISIDYDVPENPRFVRPTYDELRAVGPSLYLGRGMVRAGRPQPSLVLWFLVDARP